MPIRWSAIEVLEESKYSRASDVWAYGCVVYEVLTCGRDPYPEMATLMVVTEYVKGGGIMACPEECPQEVYAQVMAPCWNRRPSSRPGFAELGRALIQLGALDDTEDATSTTVRTARRVGRARSSGVRPTHAAVVDRDGYVAPTGGPTRGLGNKSAVAPGVKSSPEVAEAVAIDGDGYVTPSTNPVDSRSNLSETDPDGYSLFRSADATNGPGRDLGHVATTEVAKSDESDGYRLFQSIGPQEGADGYLAPTSTQYNNDDPAQPDTHAQSRPSTHTSETSDCGPAPIAPGYLTVSGVAQDVEVDDPVASTLLPQDDLDARLSDGSTVWTEADVVGI